MKIVYQAIDGKVFPTAAIASTYESALFAAWLKSDNAAPYQELLDRLNDQYECKWWGSDRGVARDLLKVFWSKLP